MTDAELTAWFEGKQIPNNFPLSPGVNVVDGAKAADCNLARLAAIKSPVSQEVLRSDLKAIKLMMESIAE